MFSPYRVFCSCVALPLLIFLSFLVIPMMCVVPWAWYQICRARFPDWEKLGFLIFWCNDAMFTDWQSPEETHAPQLFRFPLPKSLQLASKSKPMKQVEFEIKERVQVKLLSKLLLACTIQFSWRLLTDSPQFFSTDCLPLFVLTASTLFSAPLKFHNKLSNFRFPALSGVTHDSRWSQTPSNEQDSTGPSDSKKDLLLGFDKSCSCSYQAGTDSASPHGEVQKGLEMAHRIDSPAPRDIRHRHSSSSWSKMQHSRTIVVGSCCTDHTIFHLAGLKISKQIRLSTNIWHSCHVRLAKFQWLQPLWRLDRLPARPWKRHSEGWGTSEPASHVAHPASQLTLPLSTGFARSPTERRRCLTGVALLNQYL